MSRGRGGLPTHILLPLANPRTAADLVRIGAALMEHGGVLTALGIVEVAEGSPLSEGATRARQARRLLQRVQEFAPDDIELRTTVRIGRRAAEGILEAATEEEADLILFGWGGPTPAPGRKGARTRTVDAVFSPTIDEVVREAPCDIAVVKQRGVNDIRRILVPVRGGPHAELALRFADALGRGLGAEVEALHVVPPGIDPVVRSQTERALAAFVRLHTRGRAKPSMIEGSSIAPTIIDEADRAGLVVMGATALPAGPGALALPAESGLFGALPEAVVQQARPTVIVVKTRDAPSRAVFDRRAAQAETLEAAERAASAAGSVPARVDRWFAESNFSHLEFSDIGRLAALKERQGLTISLVLPTLEEAATIGPIVRRARRELMERNGLVDELVVIDSGSTDETVHIANEEGARVVLHADVLPAYGTFRGKGEALWKSLFATSGDLIAWCDTDIRDWHPRFVYGTLGPLLAETRLGYVKGYYNRPIVEGGVLKEGGGGRVTELVARPLINLFYPELSGVIQPLSGEYAGRRSLLESIPFFTGYAVEIGHLIDIAERVGLDGIGQVDLDVRVHRNQELEGLSRMSFVILQAAMKRLEERHRARLFAEIGSTMKLPRSSPGRLSLDVYEIADQERPPMIRIPEYAERRAEAGGGADDGTDDGFGPDDDFGPDA
ncbi:MAG TPA: glucosyl-3-phosphoglycerate synthase [Candidatus Saccharimonadia bacterium]|nr:glucosyl-3-phosphoglycerate synthase [Candidatus Saccharimonadia bacterium]